MNFAILVVSYQLKQLKKTWKIKFINFDFAKRKQSMYKKKNLTVLDYHKHASLVSLTRFSTSALCRTHHWNDPVKSFAYVKERPTIPADIPLINDKTNGFKSRGNSLEAIKDKEANQS